MCDHECACDNLLQKVPSIHCTAQAQTNISCITDAQVIWKRLYSSCSGMDTGTLFQLRNVINRRNVITDVSKDLTACEEFMQLATIAHVMSAAIHIAGVTNMHV